MKEVAIITNYFPPETGAASNRIYHLADGLQKRGFKIQVLTPLPNYPTGQVFEVYKRKFKVKSTENNIIIHRLWIYASNSKNKLRRLFAMLSYSFSLAWFFAWHKIPKTVIIQSPPLLVAFTSLMFLRSKKHKLILNVSDLWPLAGLELGVFKRNFSYGLLEKLEGYNYKKADLILGQSEEILTHITKLFPDKPAFLYRNYPDFEIPIFEPLKSENKKIKIVYAGLLGVAQGIYKLVQNLDYSNIEFHIYGNGNETYKVKDFIKNNKSLPIFYHGEVSREKLHEELVKYDVTIVPLLNRIYGSVPSKIFEYARLGLPILYFGGGEGETIVKKLNLGWVANVRNYSELNKIINSISNEDISLKRNEEIKKIALNTFSFDDQLNELIDYLS